MYYSEGALKLRIVGQLLMLSALDRCIENNYQVLMLNTDSIDVMIDENQQKEYRELIDAFAQEQNVKFEHETIDWTIATNINNYIQKAKSGKVKHKGFFKIKEEIPLGDSVNELVVPFALNNYFVNNTPLEETISNPEKYGLHIYDYCCSKKFSKDYEIWHDGKIQQNLNRYYFSKPAPFLLKRKKEGASKRKINATFEHVNVSDPVRMFNNYEELPFAEYKVNYGHYISKARAIVDELEISTKQLTLF